MLDDGQRLSRAVHEMLIGFQHDGLSPIGAALSFWECLSCSPPKAIGGRHGTRLKRWGHKETEAWLEIEVEFFKPQANRRQYGALGLYTRKEAPEGIGQLFKDITGSQQYKQRAPGLCPASTQSSGRPA